LLARLRRRVDELFAQEGDQAGAEFKPEPGCHRLANLVDKGDVFRAVIAHPRVLEGARHVLGPDLKRSSLNARSVNPRGGAQPLHADMAALPDERGSWVCNTVWMLDASTPDNGALRLVPGSHRQGAAAAGAGGPSGRPPGSGPGDGAGGHRGGAERARWHGPPRGPAAGGAARLLAALQRRPPAHRPGSDSEVYGTRLGRSPLTARPSFDSYPPHRADAPDRTARGATPAAVPMRTARPGGGSATHAPRPRLKNATRRTAQPGPNAQRYSPRRACREFGPGAQVRACGCRN
jgi:hypothetical protein